MSLRVPKYRHAAQFHDIRSTLMPEIEKLLLNGEYVLGERVADFERRFADFLGVSSCVGVNSGTDALVLALEALGVGPGDEVITVANTFHATALAIQRVGATPVFADCRPDDYLMDLEQAHTLVTGRTRALILVHLFGRAADVSRAAELCEEAGLYLVEDCAQAIGAKWSGHRVGSTSDAGCWSFAPSKNLAAAGDAGAVSTADTTTAKRLGLLRNFGQRVQNDHTLIGHNSRLDELQAVVLRHKLARVDAWNHRRAEIAANYREQLAGLPVSFQDPGPAEGHVYHLFQLRAESRTVRDRLLAHLLDAGVDAVVRYPVPLHLQPSFHPPGRRGAFPVAEALAETTSCLPIHPDLTEGETGYVCDAVRSFFE